MRKQPFGLLDLPELVLENILFRLSVESLCVIACVNKELRVKSSNDRVWEPRFNAKWGNVITKKVLLSLPWTSVSPCHIKPAHLSSDIRSWFVKLWRWPLSCIWPISLWLSDRVRSKPLKEKLQDARQFSTKLQFAALERGTLWFPCQVFNREYGHVGYMLSCYDAEVSYDRSSDSFFARYPPHDPDNPFIEEGVPWEKLRASPVDEGAYDLHQSGSLVGLMPGDYVEVQWRLAQDIPYGWWFGVIGHRQSCTQDCYSCTCHLDDLLWLEFNQYDVGSQWRRAAISRHFHSEEGDEIEGFYGGIMKLESMEQVNVWRPFWPSEILE